MHGLIARKVWTALRQLGIGGGRMLVLGQDAEIFAGLPADERRLEPGALAGFTAPIPIATAGAGPAPHPGLRLRTWDAEARERHDVVFGVPEYSDVSLHRPGAAVDRHTEQIVGILGCLANTEPGGYTVALVAREVLDDPDEEGRRLLTELGELVGALRLPAGALRRNPGNDACVDLLILRRHFGQPVEGHLFLPSHPQLLAGHTVKVNAYFLARPRHVLGRLSARANPWGPPEVTVPPCGLSLNQALTAGLDNIVQHALEVGLTANTDHSIDLDAPIEYSLVDHQDLGAARQHITRLREQERPGAAGTSGPSPRRYDRPGPGM